ncbi:MAG TPA: heparinase II/III family protein [Xanthobacteraceae bacterium]|nr:heparinase II/III family protein [Xanthobacteraceae bacterium]
MSRHFYAEQAGLARFITGFGWRRLRALAMAQPMLPWNAAMVPVPSRLLVAPLELRTGDGARAAEFYAGRFAFAGKVAEAAGHSPFDIPHPSREWGEALLCFGWLRHMHAAGNTLARANARSLVGDWITLHPGREPVGWAPEVAARRLISWFAQAPLILHDADQAFHKRFMRSLADQVRYLRAAGTDARDGRPRLVAAIALCFAGLCMADQARLLRGAQRQLAEELDRQILPDGGHISRNPGVLIDLLLDLLPLRQTFQARNLAPPPALMHALDRMMPMLRFFRHGDGAFAHFNGMGPTPADSLATVLAYDDARGAPVANAPHSGFQRIEGAGTVVIADTGTPPPVQASHEAHAGCLSFELSSGRHRIVINCGMPDTGREVWRPAARQTAAHSTLVVGEVSSCRFLAGAPMVRLCGAPVLDGPADVPVERAVREGAQLVRASHDGYARRFGLIHQRSWRLAPDGGRLDGEDVLRPAKDAARAADADFAVRFHLHPGVVPSRHADGHTVVLALPNGENWLFISPGIAAEIEESVYLAAHGGPRRCDQIVLAGAAPARIATRIAWTFLRTDAAPPPAGRR